MEAIGFELVRRGYDRHEVDAYISTLFATKSPVPPPQFRIAWRGYDRERVDTSLADLRRRYGA
ncbi:hypothetical protein [Streptomyces laurentii]|uniref:hypothetical protein n=1 Tax=Streptomyces laurentii TaxID=39478 RepID=UPI0033E4A4A0